MRTDLLSAVPFSAIEQWDVKQFFLTHVRSRYPVEKLGRHLIHQTAKVRPSDYPDDDFNILGVSNKIGMFDAAIQKGKDIRQKYHIVQNGWIAYNPYRINVGSVGIKTPDLKGGYISPAYVVFSCKETLLPEFLWLMMKSDCFNSLINDSTTGSVRQTLRFERLAEIEAPIPSIPEQKALLKEYHSALTPNPVKWTSLKAAVDNCLSHGGNNVTKTRGILHTTALSTLVNWSFDHNFRNSLSTGYNMIPLSDLLKRSKMPVAIEDDKTYKQITVHTNGEGASLRGSLLGKKIGTKKQFMAHKGQMIVSRIDARNGAFGIVSDELDGAVVTGDFWLFDVQYVSAQYLVLVLSSQWFQDRWQAKSSGTTNRQRVNERDFLGTEIPLLDGKTQKELLDMYNLFAESKEKEVTAQKRAASDFEKAIFL